MLNKIDLQLFTILDSEIDKTLSYWCYISIKLYWKSKLRYNQIKSIFPCWYWKNKVDIYMIHNPYWEYEINYSSRDKWNFIDYLWYDNIRLKEKYNTFTFIWHYPTTNTILRFIQEKLRNKTWLEIHFFQEWIFIDGYVLDITKEIKDYTDIQKQELINFLIKLNNE